MPANNFVPRCPNCLSADHVAYPLIIRHGIFRSEALNVGPVYGERMRHCAACGLEFWAGRGVELRELEPTTKRNETRAILERAGDYNLALIPGDTLHV